VSTPEPSELGRLLLESDDSVTHLLESLTGEPLVADVVRQTTRPIVSADLLELAVGVPVLERIAVLRGRVSATPYVYAESIYPPGVLPETVRRQLQRTTDPIGRVLVDHGLRLHREELPPSHEGVPQPLIAPPAAAAVAWWRAYRLVVNDVAVFAIREWFFQSVLEAMAPRDGA
jgi:chorismate-pyruvate lyase